MTQAVHSMPIIPVEEEDIEDPDTDMITACIESDPMQAQKMMRQKLRAQAQKIERRYSPSKGTPVPGSFPPVKK